MAKASKKPANPPKRWRVITKEDYTDLDAHVLEMVDGALVFTTADGAILTAWADGSWLRVEQVFNVEEQSPAQ